ncbi:MAG: imidazole glycerol phosphate synthase subunit HisH [Desulfobacter sp.]|nr:MAG: imidazole glycerol phosphate synthase subunit HisH [Desulfobacter sp.]
MKVAIIDYKMGNLFSVTNACRHVGLDPVVTLDQSQIMAADGVILPGVGAFAKAMDQLTRLNLISVIKESIGRKKPFLGICLGMQLLFSTSEEFEKTDGLDIIKGKVVKFPTGYNGARVKVPQIGWNRIRGGAFAKPAPVMAGIDDDEFMYFVHSYYCIPDREEDILTTTRYGSTTYCSAVMHDNIIATQFHPEKSAEKGILFYKNWANLVKERASTYEQPA